MFQFPIFSSFQFIIQVSFLFFKYISLLPLPLQKILFFNRTYQIMFKKSFPIFFKPKSFIPLNNKHLNFQFLSKNNVKYFSSKPIRKSKPILIESDFFENEKNDKSQKTIYFDDGNSKQSNSSTSQSTFQTKFNLKKWIRKVYFPENYPDSVGENFGKYSGWLMIQNTVGSAAYVLSTSALLTSVVGLSSTTALPLAATINWVLKDGLGSFGMILYAAYYGRGFDLDCKRTKFRADVLFNIGVFLELLTPLVPQLFLPLASVANVAKGIGGLSAGASKAAINKTLALKDNLGDITAKLYSQGITAYLLGMMLGIQLTIFLSSTTSLAPAWLAFSLLTTIHLYSSYKALKFIQINHLSQQKILFLLDDFLKTKQISSIKKISEKEKIIFKNFKEFNLNLKLKEFNLVILLFFYFFEFFF